MIKRKIMKLTLCFVSIILFSFLFIKVLNHNNSDEVIVKKVDRLESNLYDLVTFYKFDDSKGNYIVEHKYVRKENSVYEIFNYYNIDLRYDINNIALENNILKININSSEISMHIFKKMKLSYQSINIDKLIIQCNNIEIEV